jgi:flagellar operon protein
MTPVTPNPALIQPGALPTADAPARPAAPTGGPSFGELLGSKLAAVQFSGHALQRIQRRGIDVSPPTLARLQQGVERAAGKGSRDAVVLVDQAAFVVSVRNRTVITAVDREHMKDHVFTNIDSAVIA